LPHDGNLFRVMYTDQQLRVEFPGWEITADGDRWTAARAPGQETPLPSLEVQASSAAELRQRLLEITASDTQLLLTRLARTLRDRGHHAAVYGDTLFVPHLRARTDLQIQHRHGKYRWAGSGWSLGRDTDLDHVADLVEDAMKRSTP
jgi:hypothetical protein